MCLVGWLLQPKHTAATETAAQTWTSSTTCTSEIPPSTSDSLSRADGETKRNRRKKKENKGGAMRDSVVNEAIKKRGRRAKKNTKWPKRNKKMEQRKK